MRFQLLARQLAVPVAGFALAAMVAACSSSGSTAAAGSPSASAPAPSSSAPASPSAPASSPAAPSSSAPAAAGGNAKAQITANWEAFFDGKTSAAKKISLLQNGDKFSAIIKAQAGSGLAGSIAAKVTAVVVNSATSATVSYNIVSGGQTLLPNQTGTAVNESGVWKVGDVSFCQLLHLQGTKTSACPS